MKTNREWIKYEGGKVLSNLIWTLFGDCKNLSWIETLYYSLWINKKEFSIQKITKSRVAATKQAEMYCKIR